MTEELNQAAQAALDALEEIALAGLHESGLTRQLSGALRPLERPVRPGSHHAQGAARTHEAGATGPGVYQPSRAKRGG